MLQPIPTGSKAGSGRRGGQRLQRRRDCTGGTWPVLQESGTVVLVVPLAGSAASLVPGSLPWVCDAAGVLCEWSQRNKPIYYAGARK